jgi:hypothetical protein
VDDALAAHAEPAGHGRRPRVCVVEHCPPLEIELSSP